MNDERVKVQTKTNVTSLAGKISVIVPMYNEEENIENTVTQITTVLKHNFQEWELIIVDDGSTDSTPKLGEQIAKNQKKIQFIRYSPNSGAGKALKTGFQQANGDIIVTVDADLSYDANKIPDLIKNLDKKNADIALGSPYTNEGKTIKVPFHRLIISKTGNYILRFVLKTNIKCLTSIFRAYRREVIDSLDLTSDGKEIEPEIIAKATAMGFNIIEVPAQLRGRTKGKSKFKFGTSVWTHLKFSIYQRPMILFNVVGALILLSGIVFGIQLLWELYIEKQSILRPTLILTTVLAIIGVQTMIFGFLSDQLTLIRSELLRNRREIRKHTLPK